MKVSSKIDFNNKISNLAFKLKKLEKTGLNKILIKKEDELMEKMMESQI
jgi:hypothetical protein